MNTIVLSWLSLIVSVCVILVGAVLLSRGIGIEKLSYRRYFTQSGVFEGEDVYLIEEVCNTFFLPLFFVDVEAFIYGSLLLNTEKPADNKEMQHFCSRFFLMPHTRIRRKHLVKCVSRGYYELESVHIYFLKEVIYLSAPAKIFVYPHMLPIEESVALNQEIQNNCETLRNIVYDPFSLSGVREYQHGDPFGSINFKATAKTGTLKVNEHDPLANRNFMVYINYQTSMECARLESCDYERLMEQALSHATYLTQRAIEQGYKTGFAVNAKTCDGDQFIYLPCRGGIAHYEDILKAMCRVKNSVGNSFYSVMARNIEEGMRGVEVYVFTLYVDKHIAKAIELMRRMGNTVNIRKPVPLEDAS